MPRVNMSSEKEEKKVEKKEGEMKKAGYTKHDHLFPKPSAKAVEEMRVGDYIYNLMVHQSSGVPESHYKKLVTPNREGAFKSRGVAGVGAIPGSKAQVKD